MRRNRINVCILLILSVFSFALAAPVAVKEVYEACADGVDGGEIMKIDSGNLKPGFKREETSSQVPSLPEEKEPLIQTQEPSSSSSFWSTPSQVQDPVEKEPLIQTQEPSSSSSFWSTPSQVQDPVEKKPLIQTQEPSSSSSFWSTQSQVHGLSSESEQPLLSTSGGNEVPLNSLAEGEKMFSKLRVWRRISGTAGGAVTED